MKKLLITAILSMAFLLPVHSEIISSTSRWYTFRLEGYKTDIQDGVSLGNCFITEIIPMSNGYYKISYASSKEDWNTRSVYNYSGSIYVKEGDKIVYNFAAGDYTLRTGIVKKGGYNFIEVERE